MDIPTTLILNRIHQGVFNLYWMDVEDVNAENTESSFYYSVNNEKFQFLQYYDIFETSSLLSLMEVLELDGYLEVHKKQNYNYYGLTPLGLDWIKTHPEKERVLKQVISKTYISSSQPHYDILKKVFGCSGRIYDVLGEYKEYYLVRLIQVVPGFEKFTDDDLKEYNYVDVVDENTFITGLRGSCLILKKDVIEYSQGHNYSHYIESNNIKIDEIKAKEEEYRKLYEEYCAKLLENRENWNRLFQ